MAAKVARGHYLLGVIPHLTHEETEVERYMLVQRSFNHSVMKL